MNRWLLNLLKDGVKWLDNRQLKCFLLVSFLFFSARAISPDTTFMVITASQPVDSYDRLVRAIVQVESKGDTLAYNLSEGAVGPFQIRTIRLNDFNHRTGKEYSHVDCFNYEISREIFMYYAKKIGYPNYELIARRWNGSGKSTYVYWEKVQEFL